MSTGPAEPPPGWQSRPPGAPEAPPGYAPSAGPPAPTYPQAQPTFAQAPPAYPQAPPTYPQAPPGYPQALSGYPQAGSPYAAGRGSAALLTAAKPGIVPLRPLGLGDIYDGAVKVVRSNPKATMGLSLVVHLATLLPSALVGFGLTRVLRQSTGDGAASLVPLLPYLIVPVFAQLATVLLSGLLAYVVSEAVLGIKATPVQAWRAARGRLLPLFGATLLVGIAATVLPGALVALGILGVARHSVALAVIGLVLGLVLLLVVAFPLGVVNALLGPVVVLERQGPITAIRRAFRLVRGGFWRLLGILLLTGLVTGVAGYVLRLPFSVGALGLSAFGGGPVGSSVTLGIVASTLAALVSGTVITPFTAGVDCLLYVDRRMRLEALDVQLLRFLLGGSGAGTATGGTEDGGASPVSPQAPGMPT